MTVITIPSKRYNVSLLLIACLLALAACSGGSITETGPDINQFTPAEPVLGSSPGLRDPSATVSARILFDDVIDRSPGTVFEHNQLWMYPAVGEYEFAIYRYEYEDSWPVELNAYLSIDSGTAYIGLANYELGRWDYTEGFDGNTSITVEDWSPYASEGGYLYFCVVSFGPSAVGFNNFSIRTAETAAFDCLLKLVSDQLAIHHQLGRYIPPAWIYGSEKWEPDNYDAQLAAGVQPGGICFDSINLLDDSYTMFVTFPLRAGGTDAWYMDSGGTPTMYGPVIIDGRSLITLRYCWALYLAQQAYYADSGHYGDFPALEAYDYIAVNYAANRFTHGDNITHAPVDGCQNYVVKIESGSGRLFAFTESQEPHLDLP